MKTLDCQAYQQIRTWIYRNARPLELALWKYTFEKGNKDDVISTLALYQNEDGGFGNALEADSWNPDSTPYTTLFAINILKLIGFTDISHPIYRGILKFLDSGTHFIENGWLFNIPSNNDYPHAPWWSYNSEDNKIESIGVTAELAAFILNYCDQNSSLYAKGIRLSKDIMSKLKAQDRYGDMGIGGLCVLIDALATKELKNEFQYNEIQTLIKGLVNKSIERDTSKWAVYGVRPSNYITSPDSIYYQGNEDIVQTELDYLIETRPQGGVWGITWSWFDNTPKYAKEFAISENWWKAHIAIGKVILLRNFGRIEGL